MGKLIVYMSVSLGIMILFLPLQRVSAEGVDKHDPYALGQYAINLINTIRLDPVSHAAGLGYDEKLFVGKQPWLVPLFENKLPLLGRVAFLDERARLGNSPTADGDTREPCLSQDYARTGEFGGVVSFDTGMDHRSALEIVVENRFKQELDKDFQGQRCILEPGFDLAGAAVQVEATNAEETYGKVYYVTVTLGSSLLKSRRQILNLINQVRAYPSGVNTHFLFPPDIFSREYRPLFFNELLQTLAQTETVNGDIYLHASSVIEVFPKTNANVLASWIFSSLVLNEAKGLTGGGGMFNLVSAEAGIDLSVVHGKRYDHARLTLITGIGENNKPGYSRVYGLVYVDGNLNGEYTPGEGVKNRSISIHEASAFFNVWMGMTDNTGHFSGTLLAGKRYIIQTGSMESLVERELFLMKDHFVPLKVGIL